MSKPEVYDSEGAPFGYDDLILEIVGTRRKYPIVTHFDCGHTNPTLTLAEMTLISVHAHHDYHTEIKVLEPMIAD